MKRYHNYHIITIVYISDKNKSEKLLVELVLEAPDRKFTSKSCINRTLLWQKMNIFSSFRSTGIVMIILLLSDAVSVFFFTFFVLPVHATDDEKKRMSVRIGPFLINCSNKFRLILFRFLFRI